MANIHEFIRFALTHVKKASAPVDAIYPIPYERIGSEGEWECLEGTKGEIATHELLEECWKNHYSKHISYSREQYKKATEGWVERQVMVGDCVGLLSKFLDISTTANGVFVKHCTQKGAIDDINRPWVIGEAVFNGTSTKKAHIGWVFGFEHSGKPLFLHNRGLMYGCVITRESEYKWEYRGLMTKLFSYEEIIEVPSVLRIKTPLMRGDDIKALQIALNALGYYCGVPDGICGEHTIKAIAKFCKAHSFLLTDSTPK